MRKFLALLAPVALIGCASTPAPTNPTEICQAINPNPGMFALSGPVAAEEGVKVGSVRTKVTGGRCELYAAVYVDSQVMISRISDREGLAESEVEELIQSDEYRDGMIKNTEASAQKAADNFPAGTVRFRYQYMPTSPMQPFTVTVEN